MSTAKIENIDQSFRNFRRIIAKIKSIDDTSERLQSAIEFLNEIADEIVFVNACLIFLTLLNFDKATNKKVAEILKRVSKDEGNESGEVSTLRSFWVTNIVQLFSKIVALLYLPPLYNFLQKCPLPMTLRCLDPYNLYPSFRLFKKFQVNVRIRIIVQN